MIRPGLFSWPGIVSAQMGSQDFSSQSRVFLLSPTTPSAPSSPRPWAPSVYSAKGFIAPGIRVSSDFLSDGGVLTPGLYFLFLSLLPAAISVLFSPTSSP